MPPRRSWSRARTRSSALSLAIRLPGPGARAVRARLPRLAREVRLGVGAELGEPVALVELPLVVVVDEAGLLPFLPLHGGARRRVVDDLPHVVDRHTDGRGQLASRVDVVADDDPRVDVGRTVLRDPGAQGGVGLEEPPELRPEEVLALERAEPLEGGRIARIAADRAALEPGERLARGRRDEVVVVRGHGLEERGRLLVPEEAERDARRVACHRVGALEGGRDVVARGRIGYVPQGGDREGTEHAVVPARRRLEGRDAFPGADGSERPGGLSPELDRALLEGADEESHRLFVLEDAEPVGGAHVGAGLDLDALERFLQE